MGEAYPQCGENTVWTVRCETGGSEGHTHRSITHDCHRLNCPVCFSGEVWRRSKEAAARLASVKKDYYLLGIPTDYVEYVVMAPKDKKDYYFGTVEGYSEMSNQVQQILDDEGIIGGIKFIHTTSVNRSQGASYKEYEKYRAGDPNARVRYSPHIQGVGIRRVDWKARKKNQAKWRAEGWFVKILYADGRYDNRPWNSVARKISYELGHADMGVQENGHKKAFTTWFGVCAYNNVKRTDTIEKEPEKCKCGAQCWLYWEDEKRDIAYTKTVTHAYNLLPGSFERALKRYGLRLGIVRAENLVEICEIA